MLMDKVLILGQWVILFHWATGALIVSLQVKQILSVK